MNAEKANYSIKLLCRVMEVTRSGFYKWLRHKEAKRELSLKQLKEAIEKIHTASRGTYGRRRVHSTCLKQSLRCGKNRVAKLMKVMGLSGVGKRKFKRTTILDRTQKASPNLIVQDFQVNAPNVLWTSDITYIPTREGWLYLSVVLDTFSRSIIGWSMQDTLQAELVTDAIEMALKNRQSLPGIIFHSDKGSQYTSKKVRQLLHEHKFHQSMSSTGNCFDNAITETFFATLKKELIHRCNFRTRREAKTSIFEYIEVFYNRARSHSALGFLSPAEFEGI